MKAFVTGILVTLFVAGFMCPADISAQEPAGGPGLLESRARHVTGQDGIPKVKSSGAIGSIGGIPVLVQLRITVDATGRVAEARALSSPTPAAGRLFGSTSWGGRLFAWLPLGEIDRLPVPEESVGYGQAYSAAYYQLLTQSSIWAVRTRRYEPPAQGPVTFDVTFAFSSNGQVYGVSEGTSVVYSDDCRRVADTQPLPASSPDPAARRWSDVTLDVRRAGIDVGDPATTRVSAPCYPPIAMSARVRGEVVIEALVEPSGKVGALQVVRGDRLLVDAAAAAIERWEFAPTVVDGKAVPVVVTKTIDFSLN